MIVSQVWTQNNTAERHIKVKEIYYVHRSFERKKWHVNQGPYGRSSQGSESTKKLGSQKRVYGPMSVFIGLPVEYTSKKHEGISLVCSDVTMSQWREGKKGNLWQWLALSYWCIWLLGMGACDQFVGILKNRENMRLKKITIQKGIIKKVKNRHTEWKVFVNHISCSNKYLA